MRTDLPARRGPAAEAQTSGDTLISKPAPDKPKWADTVDLVERATQPQQISTLVAIALLLLLRNDQTHATYLGM